LGCEVASVLVGVDGASIEEPDTLAQLSSKIDQEEIMQKAAVEHLENLKLQLAKKPEEVDAKERGIQARSLRLDSFREKLKEEDRTEGDEEGEGGKGEPTASMEEDALGMDTLVMEEGASDANVDKEAASGGDMEEARVRSWAEEMDEVEEGGVKKQLT
jgi:hypothetical protein